VLVFVAGAEIRVIDLYGGEWNRYIEEGELHEEVVEPGIHPTLAREVGSLGALPDHAEALGATFPYLATVPVHCYAFRGQMRHQISKGTLV
jgi:hypothetical protein